MKEEERKGIEVTRVRREGAEVTREGEREGGNSGIPCKKGGR